MNILVLVKGAGDIATGVAHRLLKCGMPVVMTEIGQPTAVRRGVSFAEAVYQKNHTVEGITARLAGSHLEAGTIMSRGEIPVLVDPSAEEALRLKPAVVVDAILAKRNTGTGIFDAPLVIGLGPGFTAGKDVHAVVETNRGHHLGRVLWCGSAQPDTGIPAPVKGFTNQRLLRAPAGGLFSPCADIGSQVKAGEVLGYVDDVPVRAEIDGCLRGLIKEGILVCRGLKLGDIEPDGTVDQCYTISDKARSAAGGVLEAILSHRQQLQT